GISQIAQSSDGLNRLTEDLRVLVGRFKLAGAGQPEAASFSVGGDGYGAGDRPAEPGSSHEMEDRPHPWNT
ncbi:MAG: hypothetical protein ACE5G0_19065, partial [Rhodothermales bacterium]